MKTRLFILLAALLCAMATFAWNSDTVEGTHTAQCKYCTTAFTPETHTFVDDICIICGVKQHIGNDDTSIENVERPLPHDNAWYTLDGRRLQDKPTAKGVYIKNGNKVVNK